ncbi:MAG: cytochrome b N-terminal domain-containing protein [Actinomycetia bacterium]|nr:cytochrome b N-terminal domain-containing protein [Actinomycetes bacterium]
MLNKIYNFLDERLDITSRFKKNFMNKLVPPHARNFIYCFGGITFLLFLIQGVSGIVLSFYYIPTPDKANASVFYISHYVSYGWLLRSIHHWGANLMVAFCILHLLRVFFTGSYKPPRELNWIAGVFLLVFTMAFALTGYLLRWDQLSYWGTTVVTTTVKNVPLLGPTMAFIMLGGENIAAPTLTRFFSMHVFFLPLVIIFLMVTHFWMIRKQGISGKL